MEQIIEIFDKCLTKLKKINNRYGMLEEDLYINRDDLIKEANLLYEITKNKNLSELDKYYINDMNRYINKYQLFKQYQIKTYIKDLKEYCE